MQQSFATILWGASLTAIKPSFRAVLTNLSILGSGDSRIGREQGAGEKKG